MVCQQGCFIFCFFWLISVTLSLPIDVSQSNIHPGPIVIIPASGQSEEPATFGQLKAQSLHSNDTRNSAPPVVVAVEPLSSPSATLEAPSSPVPAVAGTGDMMQDSKVDERPVTSSNRSEENFAPMILVPADTIIPADNNTASNASMAENAAPADSRAIVVSNTEATSEATTEATTEAITEASTERTSEATTEASSSVVVSNASSSIPATITDKADIVTTVNAPLVVVVTNGTAPVAVSQAFSNDSASVPKSSEEQAPKQTRDFSNAFSNGPASNLAANTTNATAASQSTSSAADGMLPVKEDISLIGSAGHQDSSNDTISSTEASHADLRALDVSSVEHNETVSNPSGHAAVDISAPIAPPPLLAPEPVGDSALDKAGHSDFSAAASNSTDNHTSDFAALSATKSKVDEPAPKQMREFSGASNQFSNGIAVNDSVLMVPKPNASDSHDSTGLSSQASEPAAIKISSEFNAANPPALNFSESAADSSSNATHESAASGPVESNRADPGMPAAHAGNESSSHITASSDKSSVMMADLSRLAQQLAKNSDNIAQRSSEINASEGHSSEHSSSGGGLLSSNGTSQIGNASNAITGGTEVDNLAKSGSSVSASDQLGNAPVATHSTDTEPKQARQLSDGSSDNIGERSSEMNSSESHSAEHSSSGGRILSSNENWGKWEMGDTLNAPIGGTEIDNSAKSGSSLSASDQLGNAMVAASSSSDTEPKKARQLSDTGNPTTAASPTSEATLLASSFSPSSDGASSDVNSTPFPGISEMTSSVGSAITANDASSASSDASFFGSTFASSSGPFSEGSVPSSTDAIGSSPDASFFGSTFDSSSGGASEASTPGSNDDSSTETAPKQARQLADPAMPTTALITSSEAPLIASSFSPSTDGSFSDTPTSFSDAFGMASSAGSASTPSDASGSSPDASFFGSTFSSSSHAFNEGSVASSTVASASSPDASFFGSTFASPSGAFSEGSVATSSDVSSSSPEGDILGSTSISSSEATSERSVFMFSSTPFGSSESSSNFTTEQANGDMSTSGTGEPISSESSDRAIGSPAAPSLSSNSSAAAEGNLSPPVQTSAEQLVNLFGPEAVSLNLSEPIRRQVREFLDRKASSEAANQPATNASSAISSSNDELTSEAAVSEQTMETSTEAIKSSPISGNAQSPSEVPVSSSEAAALSGLSNRERTESKADKQVRQFQGQNQNAAAAVNNAVQGVAALNAQLFGVQFTPHFRQLTAKSAQAPEPFAALDDLRGKVRLEADTAYEIMTTARAGVDYPNLADIPFTSFSCERVNQPGFYADTDPASRCQVIRRCDANAIAWAYLCPNATVFNQITLTCDWFFNVDCGRAERYYDYSNSRLYQEGVVLLDTALSLPTAVNTNNQFNAGQGLQQNQNTFNQGQQGIRFNQNQNQFNQGPQNNMFGQNQNQFAQNQQSNQNRNGKK